MICHLKVCCSLYYSPFTNGNQYSVDGKCYLCAVAVHAWRSRLMHKALIPNDLIPNIR